MTGEQFSKLLDHLGLSNTEAANLLNEQLGKKYRSDRVNQWRKEKPPEHVAAFMDALVASSATPLPTIDDLHESPAPDASSERGDTPPPEPERDPALTQIALPTGGGIYARICTDLWATIALMVSSGGAITGSKALVEDGRIIDADKEKLGAAWGKLAETNETFRRMLVSATTGGAWLEITLVTGVTANKMLANHRRVALGERAAKIKADEGDGNTVLHAA
jgi:hypothetical protein